MAKTMKNRDSEEKRRMLKRMEIKTRAKDHI